MFLQAITPSRMKNETLMMVIMSRVPISTGQSSLRDRNELRSTGRSPWVGTVFTTA